MKNVYFILMSLLGLGFLVFGSYLTHQNENTIDVYSCLWVLLGINAMLDARLTYRLDTIEEKLNGQ